jgi:hypothetical protein
MAVNGIGRLQCICGRCRHGLSGKQVLLNRMTDIGDRW